jgi:hypothetical protein
MLENECVNQRIDDWSSSLDRGYVKTILRSRISKSINKLNVFAIK